MARASATKIERLTEAQQSRFPEFVDKWIKIGLSTEPADRPRAEKAIAGIYRLANLKEPRVIWLPCPISAALSAVCYAAIINHRLVAAAKSDTHPVRSAVRSAVDSAVDSAVYSAVDSAVDSAVRSAVRSAVYSAVGSAVDSAVDSAVGSAVYSAGYSYFGGSVWNAGYSAWADYFDEVCAVALDRNFLEMTASAGFYWMLDGVCFASERPSKIARDSEARLHCETGHAIEYAGTGWGLTAWHGVVVPRVWIERRADLTVAEIFKETSAERRRAGCEIIGWDRVLSGIDARLLNDDGDPQIGALYEGTIPGATKCTFLKVQCGTGRQFVIPTAPNLKTAIEAQAWIQNVPVKQWVRPEVRG